MAGKYCPECGAEVEDVVFCPECGANIGDRDPDTGSDGVSTSDNTNMESDDSDDDGLNITLGKIVGYIFGPLLILAALGISVDSVGAAVLYLFAGLISLPIVRAKLKESQGISLSRWATVGIVIVLVLAGGAAFNASGGNGTGAVDDGSGSQSLIEKPPSEIVIQLDQLGSGWTETGSESNETYATAEYFNTNDEAFLVTTVNTYETVDAASSAYDERSSQIRERYGTDTVDVGDEGLLYSISDSRWVVYRDANTVVEVQYQIQFGLDPEGQAIDYAEMVEENANS